MKNKTAKKDISRSSKTIGLKKTGVGLKKKTKKTAKIPVLKVVPKESRKKSALKLRKGSVMKMKKIPLKKSFGKVEKLENGFTKGRGELRVSSEFAITVILLLAGIFGYILWMGNSDRFFAYEKNQNLVFPKKSKQIKASDEPVEKWKLFRSDGMGNEFRLPPNWKFLEEEGKFVSEDSSEEIVILPENSSKASTAEELLEEVKKQDEGSNVQLIAGQNGVKIEKREGDTLKQVAKIFLGKGIVSVTYSAYGSDSSDIFFEKIVPTFKTL